MGPRGTELDPRGPITWSSAADSAPPSMPSSALAAWAGPAHFPQAPRGSGAGEGSACLPCQKAKGLFHELRPG